MTKWDSEDNLRNLLQRLLYEALKLETY